MIFGIYVVYDKVALQSGFIHEQVNDGVALREFSMFINDRIKQGHNADDFELLKLGRIEHETNNVVIYDCPEKVVADIKTELEEEE